MNTWVKNLTVLSFVLAMIVVGGVCNSQAADFGRGNNACLKTLTPPLSPTQLQQLSAIVITLKTDRQTLHADRKALEAAITATPPVAATIVADAEKVANDKAAIKAEIAKLIPILSTAQVEYLENCIGPKVIDRLLLQAGRMSLSSQPE
jgi:hypothetical protein